MPTDRRYGNNEQMALGFLFASILFSLPSWLLGLFFVARSTYWSRRDKVIAGVLPLAVAFLAVGVGLLNSPLQNWMRLPLMFVFVFGLPLISPIYLLVHDRLNDRSAPVLGPGEPRHG